MAGIIASAQQQVDAENNASKLAQNPSGVGDTSTNSYDVAGNIAKGMAMYEQNVKGYGTTTTPPTPVDYTSQLNGFYNKSLGRNGDASGLSFWNNKLNNGVSMNDVQSAIGNSNEHTVQGLYGSDLNRHSDTAGMDFFNNAMNNGSTAAEVDQAMKNSDEYKGLHGIINRNVTPPVVTPPGGTPVGTTPPVVTAAALTPQVTSSYTPSMLSTPNQWNITKDQTTQGQMTNMIDPNNPYYQTWKNAGANDAAARGFTGNSTIRDSAILDSVMRNATPIAQSDAAIHAKAAGYNADMPNQFAIHNQDATNTAGQFNSGQANQMTQAQLQANTSRYGTDINASTSKYGTDSSAETARYTANVSADTQKFVSGLSSQTQKDVAGMNNASQQTVSAAHDANAVLIQNDTGAQQAYNSFIGAVAQINQNGTMDEFAKAKAVDAQKIIFNEAIAARQKVNPNLGLNQSQIGVLTPAQQKIKDDTDHATAVKVTNGKDVSDMLTDFSTPNQ